MVARVPAHAKVSQGGVGRVAVGIDPSRAALQIALLSPHGDERRERGVPPGLAAVDVLGDDHTDPKDARGLAQLANWKSDLAPDT